MSCLVVNPIIVDGYASLFNCTTAVWASDSMTASCVIQSFSSIGEDRAYLSLFCTFVRFVLLWNCRFPLPLGVWEGLRFVIVALPGLFSYLFFFTVDFNFSRAEHKLSNDVYFCPWLAI